MMMDNMDMPKDDDETMEGESAPDTGNDAPAEKGDGMNDDDSME